jgi:excisionase family DNA binding protein
MIENRTASAPKVLTTGQIARICNVAPRTVSKWFDLGQLRGYRIPGSRDRRVPLDQLVRFLKVHNMPMNGLDAGPRRVLLLDGDLEMSQVIVGRLNQAGFQAQSAETVFEAGVLVERFRPHALIVDDSHAASAAPLSAFLRRDAQLADIKLISLEEGDSRVAVEPSRPFHAQLTKPFNVSQLLTTLNELV